MGEFSIQLINVYNENCGTCICVLNAIENKQIIASSFFFSINRHLEPVFSISFRSNKYKSVFLFSFS